MYDIHAHVLPGIDDGAKSLADSLTICQMAVDDGIRAMVATPHIREGRWPNRRGGIATRVDELNAELIKRQIPLQVHLGAEVYFAFGVVEAIQEGEFPTYADGRRYFLYELPSFFILRQVQDTIFSLRTAGLTPVIAHPERNPQLMANVDSLIELVRMGALLQLTAMSITGRFGRSAKKASDLLLGRGLVHVVASDVHNVNSRPAILSQAYARIASDFGDAAAQRLFVENPRRIIHGEDVEGGVPFEAPTRNRHGLRGIISRVFG